MQVDVPATPPDSATEQSKPLELRITEALSIDDLGDRNQALRALEGEIRMVSDVDDMLALWAACTSVNDRDALLATVLRAWAAFDPAGAAEWVLAMSATSISVQRQQLSLLSLVMRKWAETDPVSAIECADRVSSRRDTLVYQIVRVWVEHDPETAAAALPTLGLNAGAVRMFWGTLVSAWSRTDPQAAIAFLSGLAEEHPARKYLNTAIAELGASDPIAALALARDLDASSRPSVVRAILRGWLSSDSDEAMRVVKSSDWLAYMPEVQSEIVLAMVRVDVTEALALLGEIKDPAVSERTLAQVITAWAGEDPDAALAYVQRLPADHPVQEVLPAIAGQLASSDPKAALSLAMTLTDARRRSATIQSVLTRWAQDDFEAALAYARSEEGEAFRSAESAIIIGLAGRDHERAFDLAGDIDDKAQRDSLMQRILVNWAIKDPSGAVEQMDAMDTGTWGDSVRLQAARSLVSRDPLLAMKAIEGIENDSRRVSGLKQVVWSWARDDASAALAYVGTLADDELVATLQAKVLEVMAETDLASAVAHATALPEGEGRLTAVRSLAKQWSRIEPRAAVDWYMDNAETDPSVADTLKSMLQSWAWNQENGYEESAEWIVAQGTDWPDDVLDVLIERLARADVDAALAYAKSLPNTESGNALRTKAYEMAIREMARVDGGRAAELVGAAGLSTLSAVVVNEVVFNWAGQNPAEAAAWVETFPSDSSLRSMAVSDVYYQWSRTDSAAAREWMQSMQTTGGASGTGSRRVIINNSGSTTVQTGQ
jgi:hypothetical protein